MPDGSSLRVAINLEQLLTPSPGGVGRYAAQLALHLSSLGVEVVPVVARHSEGAVDAAWREWGLAELARPRRMPLPRPLLYDAWHLLAWPPLAGRGAGIDLVHAPYLAVPPRQGVPLVVSVHDAAPWRYPDAFSRRGRWFHERGLRAAVGRADCVLTGTQAAADELAELARLPAGLVRVVPYAAERPASPPSAEDVGSSLQRLGLLGATYVLWVGSLEPRKGVKTLVAAMARLAERRPRGLSGAAPKLVLAGFPGWQQAGLIDDADVAVLGSDLCRLGRVTDADLQALYAGAAIFAFPSLHEGFGLPVLEAMAAGTPVIASDIPALREVAGDAAVLVPPGDADAWAQALEGLLAEPTRRAALVEAGRHRASRYSWEATAAATLAVYRELVG